MTQQNQLSLFSVTELQDRAPDGYPVSCPTLDLSATWDASDRNLLVYRPPGQVVSKIHQVGLPGQKAPDAQAVTWRSDGQFLAVGWSDGFVRLMGLENNKAAHHLKVGDTPGNKITHIGWASSSIADNSSNVVNRALGNNLGDSLTLDENSLPLDLPRELTFLEVDTALPKISPLPNSSAGSGEDALVFTLRTGIEFLFQPPKPEEYDQVSVMIVGTSDGQIQISIYDSFIIGNFECPRVTPSLSSQLILHASHPKVSTHALLFADKADGPTDVHLVPIDMPFIHSSPINLSLLASKLTTLQKLLRYLKQSQLHMQVEWRNTRELPTRFLRSIEGDLESLETGPRSVVSALYHLAVTGHAYEPVREWLVESLAERGHKRWDKAVVSGLEGLRNLVHENYLPALDRCAIILSRLRGLAQYHHTRDDIGFTLNQINRLMDIVQCLQFVGHKVLINVMDELENFIAFSTWLRFQIDRLASSSSMSEELTEKEATMDVGKVLTYIEHYLTDSPLKMFFDEMRDEEYEQTCEHIESGPSLLHALDQQLMKWENGQPGLQALSRVEFLVSYVTNQANRTFSGIAEAKKRSVRLGNPIRLSIGGAISHMDMRMNRTKNQETSVTTALATKETKNEVQIFCVGIDIINGISTNRSPASCRIDLGTHTLIAFKFLDDETLAIMCNDQDNAPQVICVPIQSDKLSYSDYDPDKPNETSCVSVDGFTAYSFPENSIARPLRLEVNDRNNVRDDMPARVCVLESNRTTLKTFAFPSTKS
ncbi:anaphase-promoting complex subunit 4 [Fusarium sporotrichioides]|uniref:Anaphase-promoting complex subunit 4 n=1 Tax=Fusarium sporotrichioides TaxID=5514 RepID=A0A395SMH1_FUSSP|nr:anaphase-promoting complex subunit 4 [Fusarium sporotrichioides]